MKYRHIQSGIVVNSDSDLPAAVYERIAGDPDKPVEKPPRKRAAKKAKAEEE